MKPTNRVMFVDDEEALLVGWNRLLSERGLEVATARDGLSAIEELRDHPADVVISDLRMPSVDGLELLEWLREQQPETRFILVTGYGDEEVERRARELGAFEYLNKPASPETLGAVITAALQMGLIPEEAETEAAVVEAAPEVAVEVAPEVVEAPERGPVRSAFQIAGSLIAAPLIGLAFVIFLPVIGFGVLLRVMGETIWHAVRPGGASHDTTET